MHQGLSLSLFLNSFIQFLHSKLTISEVTILTPPYQGGTWSVEMKQSAQIGGKNQSTKSDFIATTVPFLFFYAWQVSLWTVFVWHLLRLWQSYLTLFGIMKCKKTLSIPVAPPHAPRSDLGENRVISNKGTIINIGCEKATIRSHVLIWTFLLSHTIIWKTI